MIKRVSIAIVLALLIFIGGCGDPSRPLEMILAGEIDRPPIQPVPAEIADIVWGNEESLKQREQEILADPTAPPSVAQFYTNRIAMIQRRKAYYQKYIDAGGIAIMGSDFLEDVYFLCCA